MKKRLLAALFLALCAVPAFALDLGDSAPEIRAAKWITGDEADPAKPDGAAIFLVEVWSTTCPPCVRSIPLLNDLQKRYEKDGLKIVSFTTDAEADVLPFLEQHPMEYSSFLDAEGATYINYMAVDNRNTIPHAFLFDRSGRLVWIGNPLDNLEEKIKGVLDGSLNGEKALAVRAARDRLQAAFEEQNISAMFSALADLEDLEPANPQYFELHHRLLGQFAGDPGEISEFLNSWYERAKDSVESLIVLSMVAAEQGMPEHRDPDLALKAARRAFSLDSPRKIEAGLTLAEVYKGLGRLDLTIGALERMLDLGSPEERELLQSVLEYSRKAHDLGKAQKGLED